MHKNFATRSNKIPRWFFTALTAAIIAGAAWLWRPEIVALVDFLRNKDAISQFLESMGLWGPLLYVAILGLDVLTIIVPGHALMFAAGYLYGFEIGLLLNILGAVGASQLAFAISRYTGDGFVEKFVPAGILYRWENIVKRQGILFFMLSFWFPIIPSNITNYIAGISPISFLAFFAANFVGRLPGLIFITLFGAYGLELSPQQWLVVAVAAVLAMAAGRYVSAKLERRYAPGPAQ